MKSGIWLRGALLAIVAGGGAYWMLREEPLASPTNAAIKPEDPALPPLTEAGGRFPKVKTDELTFDFGIIELGDKGSHDFVIRNEGDVPLLLTKGEKSPCQCTVSHLEKERVEPGESCIVTLTWEPTSVTEAFDKWARINTNETNDRRKNEIEYHVKGVVTTRVLTYPLGGNWGPIDLHEESPTVYTGKIVTRLKETFQITEVASENPLVTAEWKPLDLADPMQAVPDAQFGYAVTLTFRPGIPVGAFTIPLKIKTDMIGKKNDEPLEFPIIAVGTRRGPFRIVSSPAWVEHKATIGMGTFPAGTGRKVTLRLHVKGVPPEGLQLISAESEPSSLKVDLTADAKYEGKGSGLYQLTVEFPAGGLRINKNTEDDAGLIRLKTNHPNAPEMQFKVMFNAT